jgi:hypothetical protein
VRRLLPALCLIACESEPELSPCEELALAECDIRDDSCQEHYSAVLRCLRGDDQPTPALEILTDDEYRERYPADSDPPADGDALLLRRGFVLLGLTPLDPPASEAPPVPAARYDLATRTVVVVDTADTLAHVHAISQAHADAALGGFHELAATLPTQDQRIAAISLLLGETIFYGDVAWVKTVGMTDESLREMLAYRIFYDNALADAAFVARSGDLYDQEVVGSVFAAGFGPSAVFTAWYDGGSEAVRAAHDPLPGGTAPIIHHDLGARVDPVAPPTPTLPDTLRVVGEDRLGPWLLHTFQARAVPFGDSTPLSYDVSRADAIASTWQGDRVLVVHDEATDEVGVVLIVLTSDPAVWSPTEPARAEDVWSLADDGRTAVLVRADSVPLKEALAAAVAAP